MVNIIIPTYNEEENISRIIEEIFRVGSQSLLAIKITVVDDCSTDSTQKLVRELSLRYPVRLIIRHNRPKGLALSILQGIRSSQEENIGVMDADFSHPPKYIPMLYKELIEKKTDIVVASRYIKQGKIKDWPFFRIMLSKTACKAANICGLTKIKDPTSGFFFLKKQVVRNLSSYPQGFKILLEILVKGRYKKISELPYSFTDRKKGKSKMSLIVGIAYLYQIISLLKFKLKQKPVD